jgi:peptidoglycan hydrolase-like protein with peptidoglycan-binding domain
MIELVGKLTVTPYWKCLEIDKTNPVMLEQAREWYDGMSQADRVKLVQRKLVGMNLYQGPVDGIASRELTPAIGKFQAENGLIADGRINFDLYYVLLDADQPIASDPTAGPTAPVMSATPRPPAAAAAAGGPLSIKLDTERGPRPTYKPKEFLQARVQLSSDGILYCYYRDNSGVIARIFPNRFNPDSFVRSGRPMSLPPEGSPFKIRFDQPGKEQITCFASDRDLPLPASLKGADLTPLKVGSLEEISTAFRKSNPNVAEAKLEIVIR